ncbi:LGFP repeat-containing protein [Rhizobium sp.]|uniref:LGFP repeat-containing protein n=1 Tax=Rhizobium sp. TaxID=391 RepID=UPI002F14D6A6
MTNPNEITNLGWHHSAASSLQTQRTSYIHAVSHLFEPGDPRLNSQTVVHHIGDTVSVSASGALVSLISFQKAVDAITQKAASLGLSTANVGSVVEGVTGGYVGRFSDMDIYYSVETGAHEVHGDIRAKYNVLGGPGGLLGLPVTDEEPTPDLIGRFNHFTGGSIYWTQHTGPMSVRGQIKDLWATMGSENSELGYPVTDQYRMKTASASDPVIEWCQFENGMIASDRTGARVAPFATIDPNTLQSVVWKMIDTRFHDSPDNVGLHPDTSTQGVSEWHYGFWVAVPRAIGFRLHGFRDNGAAPDTDYFINLWLRFELAWSTNNFAEPTDKSVVASLDWLRVTADGFDVSGGAVINGVTQGLHDAFFSAPGSGDHPEVLAGSLYVGNLPTHAEPRRGNIDLIGIGVSKAGEFQVFVNPLRPTDAPDTSDYGILRSIGAQTELNLLVSKLLA